MSHISSNKGSAAVAGNASTVTTGSKIQLLKDSSTAALESIGITPILGEKEESIVVNQIADTPNNLADTSMLNPEDLKKSRALAQEYDQELKMKKAQKKLQEKIILTNQNHHRARPGALGSNFSTMKASP